MKKSRKRTWISILLMISVLTMSFPPHAYVKAESIIFPKEVENIDNVPYPAISQSVWIVGKYLFHSKFVLQKPGRVKIAARCANKELNGSMWISTDAKGINIIGESVSIKQMQINGFISTGMAAGDILTYLEAGEYYINYSVNVDAHEFGLGVLYEDSKTEESIMPSSLASANPITVGVPLRGFLSVNSPLDYYKFNIDKKSLVDIECKRVGDNKTQIKLLDSRHQTVSNMSPVQSSSNDKLQYLLNSGTYYIELSGTVGSTDLYVDAKEYKLNLTSSTTNLTNKDIFIHVNTYEGYKSLLWVKGTHSRSSIKDDMIWKSFEYDVLGNIIDHNILGEKFKVKKNGSYTVRVLDQFGNGLIKVIKITNIDKEKASVNVANGKTYKKGSVLKFSDKNGIKTARLNGKNITNNYKLNKAGKYNLKITDKAGNVKSIKFQVA